MMDGLSSSIYLILGPRSSGGNQGSSLISPPLDVSNAHDCRPRRVPSVCMIHPVRMIHPGIALIEPLQSHNWS